MVQLKLCEGKDYCVWYQIPNYKIVNETVTQNITLAVMLMCTHVMYT